MLRNLEKMNYYNDSTRTLLESIININVLDALKDLINYNDISDIILIGGLAVSYYSKPYMSDDIDIIVRNKMIFNKFPNNTHINGTKLDIYNLEDFNLNDEIFDNYVLSDKVKIMTPSYLMSLFFKNHLLYLRCIGFMFDNTIINYNIIKKLLNNKQQIVYDRYLLYSKKDYCMTYAKNYDEFISCKVYESKSGYLEVDKAFNDWIKYTKKENQVLIGGL